LDCRKANKKAQRELSKRLRDEQKEQEQQQQLENFQAAMAIAASQSNNARAFAEALDVVVDADGFVVAVGLIFK